MRSPLELIHLRRIKLDMLCDRMKNGESIRVFREKNRLAMLSAGLDALSPLKVLARGYAIAEKDGAALHSVKDVSADDNIDIILQDGVLGCTVCSRRDNENEEKA